MGLESLAALGAPILGGAIGAFASADDKAKQEQLVADQLAEVQKIAIPEQRLLKLQQLQQQGVFTPEMVTSAMQQDSQLNQYAEDPQLRNAELASLQKYQDISSNGGLTAQDKARLQDVQGNMKTAIRGDREAAMMDAQSRGTVGGGAALMASLGAGQAATDTASKQGMQVASDAEQRAMDAIAASGQLGGQMRTQDFSQAQAKAAAQDEINRFNTATRNTTNATNTGAMNSAQQQNLAEQQRIADTNAAQTNQETLYNNQAGQRTYQDMLEKAGALGNARSAAANAAGQRAASTQQMWGGIGQGVGYGAAAYGQKK
jgi:hypothetical protein